MDFHKALEQSIAKFPKLEGIIFVDPDGEMIIFESPKLEPFETRLSGAKMPIIMHAFDEMTDADTPELLEFNCDDRYFIHIQLTQNYSLTAVGRDLKEKFGLIQHLKRLASDFNREIV